MSDKTLNERLAWLAGIIDGEGTVMYHFNKGAWQRADGTQGESLKFAVKVGNTDFSMIEEIKAISTELQIGCNVHFQRAKNARCKPMWRVDWSSRKRSKAILTAILPWLVTKAKRAKLALSLIEYRTSSMYQKGKTGRTRPDQDEWLMRQLGELKLMNKTGPAMEEK